MKIPKPTLKWRSTQPRGAIMKPSAFAKLAALKGTKLAGWKYWQQVKNKYAKAMGGNL